MARAKGEGRRATGIRSHVRGWLCRIVWTSALSLEQTGNTGGFDLAFNQTLLDAVFTRGWSGLRKEARAVAGLRKVLQ